MNIVPGDLSMELGLGPGVPLVIYKIAMGELTTPRQCRPLAFGDFCVPTLLEFL